MSIDRDRFERSSEDELRELSSTDVVLGFLASNEDRAFAAREIVDPTGVDRSVVSTALTRLKKRALVEHKGTYWAITTDEERLQDYDGYVRATERFDEQFGDEDRSEWSEHAPDEPHPSVRDG